MIQFLALFWAQLSGKAFKCMRWRLILVVWAGLGVSAAFAEQGSALTIPSGDESSIQAKVFYWHDLTGQSGIDQISQAIVANRFQALEPETMFDLKPKGKLWIRLDLDRQTGSSEHWVAWIPLPLIDVVSAFQRTSGGAWQSWRAGDRVAVNAWPEPGRYPRFHLELPAGKSQVYLQIQGTTPVSLPIYLGSEVPAQSADRMGILGLGLVVGMLLTLVLICFVTAYTYRDRLYMLYGLYVLVMVLAVCSYTGLAAYLLWDHSPAWADASQGILLLLSAGGALYFIEAILGGRRFAHRLSGAMILLGMASVPAAMAYYFVPRSIGVIILGIYMMLVSGVGLSLAARAWRLGDAVGKWVFVAYLPLALAVLIAVARAYGWILASWFVQYGVVMALMIEAPLMMLALHVRSRQRHEMNMREQALSTHDALTGLLTEYIFDDRIQQTMARSIKRREDAVIALISLVNYQAIVDAHGLPVAEQSVLRAVIKLRKVLRDEDTVARVGVSQFGLILADVGHRSRVTDIGARLIAQGLMPLPGLVPDVTLQFHFVAALMRELPAQPINVKQELLSLLRSMSPRTRRPIRFLEVESVTEEQPIGAPVLPSQAVAAIPAVTNPSQPAKQDFQSSDDEDTLQLPSRQ
jgi:two-component system, sensor histidine kinase LadS